MCDVCGQDFGQNNPCRDCELVKAVATPVYQWVLNVLEKHGDQLAGRVAALEHELGIKPN